MTVNKKALSEFKKAVDKIALISDEPLTTVYRDETLSAGLTAALREMYTDSRVASLAVDSETGSLFAAMTDGRVYEYTHKEEGDADEWAWKEVPPIPGSIAAGGKDSD